jgi:cell division protein FtsB
MNSRQKILLSFALIAIFSLLLLIVFGDNGAADLRLLQTKRDRLIEKNETLARENVQLYHQIERLKNDPDYIESIARRELGMIGKDEVILKLRPAAGGEK